MFGKICASNQNGDLTGTIVDTIIIVLFQCEQKPALLLLIL